MAIVRLTKESINYEFDPDNHADLLGKGGMGVVFKGRRIDRETGRVDSVAIKVLFKDLPEQSITRARREASIQIEHENVIRMFGFVDVIDAEKKITCHVISEFLDGDTLDKRSVRGEVLPEKEAIKIIKSVLSGLYMLHAKGYIHRDIDPSNVMICKNGKIKLIDFGIAKSLTEYHDEFRQGTQEGKFIGKVNYASPEQAQGLHWITNTTSDIYSTGILMFELLMGRLPYSGTTYEILKSHIESPIVFDQTINTSLQNIIRKATAKKQEDRYQSVSEFIVDIEKYEKGHKISAPKIEKSKQPKKSSAAKIVGIISAIILSLIIIGGSIGYFFYHRSELIKGAQQYANSGNYKKAIEEYESATKLISGKAIIQELDLLKSTQQALAAYNKLEKKDSLIMQQFTEIGDNGFFDGYYYAAELNINGIMTPKNESLGVESLMKGAQIGNILSEYRLGEAYHNGEYVKKNTNKALEYFTKAKTGIEQIELMDLSPELLYIYGKMFRYGYSVEVDELQAKVLFEKAAEQNNGAALYELYLMLKKNGENNEAFKYLVSSANNGYTIAEYKLGTIFNSKYDYKNAVKYFEKAANKRYSPAYYQLALSYKYGRRASDFRSANKYIENMELAIKYDPDNTKLVNELNAYKQINHKKPIVVKTQKPKVEQKREQVATKAPIPTKKTATTVQNKPTEKTVSTPKRQAAENKKEEPEKAKVKMTWD